MELFLFLYIDLCMYFINGSVKNLGLLISSDNLVHLRMPLSNALLKQQILHVLLRGGRV